MSLPFVAPCFSHLMQLYLRDAARCCLCSRPWEPSLTVVGILSGFFAELWKVTFSTVYFGPGSPGGTGGPGGTVERQMPH